MDQVTQHTDGDRQFQSIVCQRCLGEYIVEVPPGTPKDDVYFKAMEMFGGPICPNCLNWARKEEDDGC